MKCKKKEKKFIWQNHSIALALLISIFSSCAWFQKRLHDHEKSIENNRKLVFISGAPSVCNPKFSILRVRLVQTNESSERYLFAKSGTCNVMLRIYKHGPKNTPACHSMNLVSNSSSKHYKNINRDFTFINDGSNTIANLSFRANGTHFKMDLYLPPGVGGDVFHPFFTGY